MCLWYYCKIFIVCTALYVHMTINTTWFDMSIECIIHCALCTDISASLFQAGWEMNKNYILFHQSSLCHSFSCWSVHCIILKFCTGRISFAFLEHFYVDMAILCHCSNITLWINKLQWNGCESRIRNNNIALRTGKILVKPNVLLLCHEEIYEIFQESYTVTNFPSWPLVTGSNHIARWCSICNDVVTSLLLYNATIGLEAQVSRHHMNISANRIAFCLCIQPHNEHLRPCPPFQKCCLFEQNISIFWMDELKVSCTVHKHWTFWYIRSVPGL